MSVFTTIGNGFYVNSTGPVDARFVVADSASRKTQFDGVYFEGLIVYQQDTQEIYVCVSAPNGVANLDTDWELVYPASGSTSDTGSLITASVAGNVIEFEKANGDLFTITVDTGSFDTSSLLITGSVNQNVLTFKKGNGDEFTLTVDTGSGGSGIFDQTGSFFATTNDLQITGSLTTTGSVNLALETSSTAVDNVMMYDSQSGEVYFTSSAAIGGSSVIYTGEVVTTPQTIRTIKTLDFNPNDALVQFNTSNGELKFIFGDPPPPSVGINQTNLFQPNRFNLEPQSFTVKGTYNKESNGFISASLKEVIPDTLTLEHTATDTGFLERTFTNRTGSKDKTGVFGIITGDPEYKFTMELTSSDAIDPTIEDFKITNPPLTLTLSKIPPDRPSISHQLDASRVVSNRIEVGATGSFNYTVSSNATSQPSTTTLTSQNWRYLEMTDNSTPAITTSPVGSIYSSISGSIDLEDYSISESFSVNVEADYDSNNSQPGDNPLNSDLMEISRASLNSKNYNRVRSVRVAAFPVNQTQSVIDDLQNLPLFETGLVKTGSGVFWTSTFNGNPHNVVAEIQNPSGYCHIVVIDATYTLTQILNDAFPAINAFEHTIAEDGFESPKVINGWRVYRTKTLGSTLNIVSGIDSPVKYTLKTS